MILRPWRNSMRKTSAKKGEAPPELRGFFTQWLNSTGIPEFTVEYVVYRTPKGFRIVGQDQAAAGYFPHAG